MAFCCKGDTWLLLNTHAGRRWTGCALLSGWLLVARVHVWTCPGRYPVSMCVFGGCGCQDCPVCLLGQPGFFLPSSDACFSGASCLSSFATCLFPDRRLSPWCTSAQPPSPGLTCSAAVSVVEGPRQLSQQTSECLEWAGFCAKN